MYIPATLKIYGKENWRTFSVYGHGMQSTNSVNSTLEWSCILAISLYCHWNHSVFHRSEQFHPQFIIKPSSGPFPFLFLFKSFHTGSQNVLFKNKSDYVPPLSQPFQKFSIVLIMEIRILNLLLCLLLWPYFLLFFPCSCSALYTYWTGIWFGPLIAFCPFPFYILYSRGLGDLSHLFFCAIILARHTSITPFTCQSHFIRATSLIRPHPQIALACPVFLIL